MAASLAALEGFIVDIVPSSRAGKNGAESLIRKLVRPSIYIILRYPQHKTDTAT
jgi:hypothetical protein